MKRTTIFWTSDSVASAVGRFRLAAASTNMYTWLCTRLVVTQKCQHTAQHVKKSIMTDGTKFREI